MPDDIETDFDAESGHLELTCVEKSFDEWRSLASRHIGTDRDIPMGEVTSITVMRINSNDERTQPPRQRWLTIGCFIIIAFIAAATGIGIATMVRWLMG